MGPVKSFFIVEFKSISSGYFIANSLVQNLATNVIEIFSQAPAKLVFLFETTDSKTTLAYIKKYKSKILDCWHTTTESKKLLNAFYGQTKPTIDESIVVIESKTLAACFEAVNQVVRNPKINIIEIDSGRALAGRSIAFLTGPKLDCDNFKKKNKSKKISVEVLSQMPASIRSLWAAQ